jgi:hypothetical protein
MKLPKRKEQCSLGQTFEFIPLGDIHLGSANCDRRRLDRVIKRIADNPDARWVGMGDLVESIAPDDFRWNPKDIAKDIEKGDQAARISDVYVSRLATVLEPIIDKCWSLNDGNHEDKFNARYYTNLNLRVLQELGQAYKDKHGDWQSDLYGEWCAMTRVTFEDKNHHRSSLPIYQQHGWQAGRKKGAKINNLDDLMGYVVGCRIYLVAHSHERLMTTKTMLGVNQHWDDLTHFDSYGAHTGSYLRTYQLNRVGYAEKKGFPPTSLGPIYFNVTPRQSGVEIEGIQ